MPQESQVSIESNVIWIDRVMRDLGFAPRTMLFAGGDAGLLDVVLHRPDDPEVRRWLPLARIHGEPHTGVGRFRRHQVPGGPTAADAAAVDTALRGELQRLAPGDGLLFIFNGHGAWGTPNAAHNTLRLWGESALDVRTYAELLTLKRSGATVRHVFPQCYAGGFVRALFDQPARPRLDEIKSGQCGFFAVPEHLEAEGCTPGIDVAEYRDYSTYFFAALAGEDRLGRALTRDPDLDGDGSVSLGEAHAYAYTEGHSTDLPFATSEYLLELWQPWYVRWHSSVRPSGDNRYLKLALRLATVLGMEAREPTALAREALTRRRAAMRVVAEQQQQITELAEREHAVRVGLAAAFHLTWPAASQPYSHAYVTLLETQGEDLLAWIRAQADYPELETLQTELEQAQIQLLDLQRDATSYARVQRMLKLANVLEHFERLATPEARETYAALQHCENWAPPTGPVPHD
ncbi:MAG: hypothetical protein ACFCUJ_04070 [Thiotrichales bacterium]